MSSLRPTPSPATVRAQRAASDPAASVFVAANAGTGKTTVLTQRVVRLLLAGVDPMRILCVTFTKVAAANMQDRVFDMLSAWVTLPDAELAARIESLEGRPPDGGEMARARRLFARALETPGGLKIQTIHAFCQRILNQFPFEAGVPARFNVLEEDLAADLLEEASLATLAEAMRDPDGESGRALAHLTETAAAATIRERIVAEARRDTSQAAPEAKFAVSPLRQALGLAPDDTPAAIERKMLEGGLLARARELVEFLDGGGSKSATLARRVETAAATGDAEAWLDIFFTQKREPRKSPGELTKALKERRPDLQLALEDEADRLFALLRHRVACAIALRSEALGTLAAATRERFAALKRRHGALDYGDMIAKVEALLSADTARWVLFKLDQGLDHVLVDEAQDTSPAQWAIINGLTGEFFAGEGARGAARRTVFAVGDEKQSIYSFQGADPAAFDLNRRRIGDLVTRSGGRFQPVDLKESFRSVESVVRGVDQVFATPEARAGLTADGGPVEHSSALHAPGSRDPLPGSIELWPVIRGERRPEPGPLDPVDAVPANAPAVRLANLVAGRIRGWIDSGERFASDGRPVTPGDILILVRGRKAVFQQLIRALRASGLPIGGVDRVKLSEQIAVSDLAALGRFALLPDDDLSLAEVLKSPLCGLDDDDLLRLTEGEGEGLWPRLAAAGLPERIAAARTRLDRLRSMARGMDPHAFYATLLGAEGGRSVLVGRLGEDAAEALEVFMARLARWQQSHPPSLHLFLTHLQQSDVDVKRDLEKPEGRIRIMTIHGAKGLESRIVILADGMSGAKADATILKLDSAAGPASAWVTGRDKPAPAAVEAARQAAEEAAVAEHKRLLYVAMTRAKDRLCIAGQFNVQRPRKAVWHDLVAEAFKVATHVTERAGTDGGEPELVFALPAAAPADPSVGTETAAAPALVAPAWLAHPPPAGDLPPAPLSPSRLSDRAGEIAASARPTSVHARARGELVHDLLDRLSRVAPARRPEAARRIARLRHAALPAALAAKVIDDTLALMADPNLRAVFGESALTEAAIAGRLVVAGEERLVTGRIDRLAMGPDGVLAVDFKTGRPPAAGSPAELEQIGQMAVYHGLLAAVHPQSRVRVALLHTDVPRVRELSDIEIATALARIAAV
jgi:ATP-dependent helicase/nuclease subunit A